MTGVRVLLFGLAVGGLIGACSSSLPTSNADAGHDAAGAVDRPAALDGNRHDGSADGQDGGAVCSPLDTSMWPASVCAATWAAAVASPQCAEYPQYQRTRTDCGAYQNVTQYGGDSVESCVYETASGKLVAATYDSILGLQCWGPPAGIPGDCSNATTTTLCLADGGVPADAGESNCLATDTPPYFTWNAPCFADAGSLCYANCVVAGEKYVGCVTDSSGNSVGARCYASCSECP
jgi:hypothetical protein